MSRGKKRFTRADAHKKYPNEWIVFREPKFDEMDTFIDGEILYHCTDQREAFRRSIGIPERLSFYYTGSIPYRTVRLHEDNAGGKRVA